MQPDGFTPVAPGKVATVVTHLEMRAQAPLRPAPDPAALTLRPVAAPEPSWYRDLFYRVGGADWLWSSRLMLSDAELTAILHDLEIEVIAVEAAGQAEGLLELDFRVSGECELAFLGLTRALVGQGAGRWLMNVALTRAWSRPITRLHVHTCTFDHPDALGFYRRSGFTPVRQEIEVMDDPRLTGILPRSAAPHVPMIEP